MDRCLIVGSLSVVFALSGCSAPQTFMSKFSCSSGSNSCCEECGERVPCCPSDSCEPLIHSTATSTRNGCGSECGETLGYELQEGCCGCTDGGGNWLHSGLEGGFERGRKNILLDGAGWIVGIPSKLLLWNIKIDSHSVSPETEQHLRRYLASRGLNDVKVRVNQYDPLGEWQRLRANNAVHPGWRYTVGAFAVAKYTLLPGRLVGNDEYNPFTNTISLYSDRASIALREGAHANRAINAPYRGLYSASMYLPGSPLWVDTYATREVLAFSQETNQRMLERETNLVLFPSYGARFGQSLTLFIDAGQGQAAQAGFALIGHAIGRTRAFQASESPMQMVKSVYGIVRRPEMETDAETVEAQNVLPPGNAYPVKFIPLDVTYEPVSDSL